MSIIAIDGVGPAEALRRLGNQLWHRTSELIVQVALTSVLLVMAWLVLAMLVSAAMVPASVTNAPELMSGLFDIRMPRSGSSIASSLRLGCASLVALTLLAYPAVFWIVSFTDYYRATSGRPGATHPRGNAATGRSFTRLKERARGAQAQPAYQGEPGKTGQASATSPTTAPSGDTATAEPSGRTVEPRGKLEQLYELRKDGLITDDDFEVRKKEILDKMVGE